MRAPDRGFSLAELMVALALQALVVAGSLAILQASMAALARVQDGLAAQGALRRAMVELSDDLQELGFRVPLGEAPPGWPSFRVEPGETGDVLTFLKEVVLPGEARLKAPPSSEGTVTLQVSRRTVLLPGDLVYIEDDRWEGGRVAGETVLEADKPTSVRMENPAFREGHLPGARLSLVRPGRLVRYSLDPQGPGGATALVRLETAADSSGTAAPAGGLRIVAPGITAFRVEAPPGVGPAPPALVRVLLEARNPAVEGPRAGLRRRAALARAPRNPAGGLP